MRSIPEESSVFSEFNISKYIYETVEENEGIDLKMYGFEKRASNIMLKIDISNFNKKNNENFTFTPFVKGRDEGIRCKVQNEIFYEENRIPLKTKDIVYECNRKAFFRGFSIFLN